MPSHQGGAVRHALVSSMRAALTRATWMRAAVLALACTLAGCGGGANLFGGGSPIVEGPAPAPAPTTAVTSAPLGSTPGAVTGATGGGTGGVKVGVILPLSAGGNAGIAGQSMRNAAEMALAEFSGANIQLVVKDDGGTAPGAQRAATQALDEGAEILLGPLFAHSVTSAKQVARSRGVPMISFSTDTNVASSGTYLLSFLPESDVDRVISYAISQNKKSFVALFPNNAYGGVVEAEFNQVVAKRGGRVVLVEHYSEDRKTLAEMVKQVAQAAGRGDALFIPDGGDGVGDIIHALATGGVNLKQFTVLGTGLWADDQRITANNMLEGAWFASPETAGYKSFAERYRARYHQDPVRQATLAYDAVALVAALVKTQGTQRFSSDVLTNPSGFTGIDGVFRFRGDGSNQRGLAVMKVTQSGAQVVSAAPHSFNGSGI
jgi:branched-chain amino acid transport system substrate-binding protein